ncbi:hypothetical protein FHU36_007482 [Nonomuraea muscovyensis]|uniref:Uncharacterized protein n=1 Tax=Nonomuraea muscovyensis TaxID=1124761 RepID=A0A7X0CB69_9ACTN|nr:hypothetical protein [Nonomuraea muscovyensis]
MYSHGESSHGHRRSCVLQGLPRSFLLTQAFLVSRPGNTVLTPGTESTGGAYRG